MHAQRRPQPDGRGAAAPLRRGSLRGTQRGAGAERRSSAVEVLQEIGISLAEQRAKNVSEYLGKLPVHYAIKLCRDVETRCPRLWPFVLRDVLSWPMEDPSAVPGSKREQLAAFRRIRDAITLRIREWLREER